MFTRARFVTALAAAASLAACGNKEAAPTTGEAKIQEATAAAAPAAGSGSPKIVAAPAKAEPTPVKATPPTAAPSRGAEHAVYSLVDNRLSAHLTREGGLVVAGGSAGMAKYLRFNGGLKSTKKGGWELRQTEGDVKVARLGGKTASLYVPLTAAQAASGVIRLRAFAKAEGAISLRVNDNKDVNGKLGAGWSTIELKVPSGQLKEGENDLTVFMHSSGTEVAWLQLGGTAAPGGGVDGADLASLKFYDPASKSLVLPKGGTMSWYVMVPDKAKLAGDLADGACQINVLATAQDGRTAEGKLSGTGAAVDLAALGGKAVRLDLTGDGCASAALASAGLVVPGAAPAAPARGEAPKYVVFVIMDSLRADRIRAINPKARPETPTWDKLTESSALFTQAFVQGNESLVSHSSIWSSNYLIKHKTMDTAHLEPKWMTIDEVAKKAGKFTAGVSANGYIRPARGFGDAWDQFSNHIEKELGLKGADVLEHGLQLIEGKKQPWFLYLGLIDTHVTWRAKAPWMDKYDGGYKGRFATEFGDDGPNSGAKATLTDREKEHIRAIYDSNVSYQDDLLNQLIEKLKAAGTWDQTMLIVTADHGDEQWEDGRFGHGASLRDMLVHVPLLIHYPAMVPAGKISEGVDDIDIVPTLADALGVAPDAEWQGQSLLPLASGVGAGYPTMPFSSQYENFHTGRIGSWKVKIAGAGPAKVYDLASDPSEMKDLWGEASAEIGARLLLDPMWIMRQWNLEWKKSQWGNAAAVSARFAADLGE